MQLSRRTVAAVTAIIAVLLCASAIERAIAAPRPDALLARGRTLVAFGSCNDCHTPGWRESDGTVAPAAWMTGSNIGYRGPWGTVYPANVRLEFQRIDEATWLAMVHTRGGHPPMKWHDLRALPDPDLRAIYRFVKSLGPAGVPEPASVPPEREPKTPYFDTAPHPAPTG
jgi:mono/diheme cytochrome c family protein